MDVIHFVLELDTGIAERRTALAGRSNVFCMLWPCCQLFSIILLYRASTECRCQADKCLLSRWETSDNIFSVARWRIQTIYLFMDASLFNEWLPWPPRETPKQPVVWNLCSPQLWLNRYECIWYSGSVIPSSVICHNYTLSGVTWLDKRQWHISPLSASRKIYECQVCLFWSRVILIVQNYKGIKNSLTVTEKPFFYRPHLCYGGDKYINIHCNITAVSLESVSQQSYISGRA